MSDLHIRTLGGGQIVSLGGRLEVRNKGDSISSSQGSLQEEGEERFLQPVLGSLKLEQSCLSDQHIPCSGAQGAGQRAGWRLNAEERQRGSAIVIAKREAKSRSLALPPSPSNPESFLHSYPLRANSTEPKGTSCNQYLNVHYSQYQKQVWGYQSKTAEI